MSKVSIIIPVYNGEKTIERAIRSCLNQTYSNIEVIVVNNASTDNTEKIIKNIEDNRIDYYYIKIKGRSIARNYGIEKSSGKYMFFLDADDIISKDKLTKGVDFLENYPSYFAHASSIEYVDEINEKKFVEYINNDLNKIFNGNIFPINSVLFKFFPEKIILFHSEIEYNEDWIFFIENLKEKKIKIDVDHIGGTVYIHGNNTMKDKKKMMIYKLFIRAKFSYIFPKKISIYTENLKLMLYYHLIIQNENDTDESQLIKEKFRFLFLLAGYIVKIPVIKKIVREKLDKNIQEDIYCD